MIRSEVDLWTSKDRTLMSSFRDSFFNSYPDFKTIDDPVELVCSLIEKCQISWDPDASLGKEYPSMHEHTRDFSFAESPYLLYTTKDMEKKENLPFLFEAICHELGHIFLNHDPSHAGILDSSDLAVMSEKFYRLYDRRNPDIEHQSDLFVAVMAFHPYSSYVYTSWNNPIDAEALSKKFPATIELSVQMLLAHSEQEFHFFYVNANNEFIYKIIPDIYPESATQFLNNEKELLDGEKSALAKAKRTRETTSEKNSSHGFNFFCRAFYLTNPDHILVLGTNSEKIDLWKMLLDFKENN